MNVITYVESNFVLQLALGQEEAPAAEAILELAESGKIELIFPIFSFSEPFSTIAYHGIERSNLYNPLQSHLTQLQRSDPRLETHQQVVAALQALLSMWKEIVRKETASLLLTVQRLLNIGESIAIDGAIFREAISYQSTYGFSIQDAIIYSSIISDLRHRPAEQTKCFISSNSKDFNYPDIKAELGLYNCRYISKFSDALLFIQSSLS